MAPEDRESEIVDLRLRLEEAEETLRAIRNGEVDALVVEGVEGERVYTLQGADHPYRELVEAMQQGAASLGGDGTVLYCNPRFAEMAARPQEKVVGASVADFLPEPGRPDFAALLRHGRTRVSRGELDFQAADGTLTPVYLALSPLPQAGVDALCMVVTDLTEQKRHQELQETNRRKDEFLAMLAHELRNPLAPIRNALYLLKRGGADGTPTEEVRAMMERQVEHLARLIDDLMDVSRIASGKVELRLEEVELGAVLARAAETSRPLMDQKRHEFSLSLPTAPVRILGDPTRLEQVFDNLLTNAAKYSDPGGKIALTAGREGDFAVVRLRDAGIGIAPEKLPHIFDLFVQAERRLDRSQGGLGIGLSLVRSLVGLHGGVVWAHSEGLGRGSEFLVRLPVLHEAHRPAADGRGGGKPHATVPLIRRRILVVDDNVDSARSMSLLLKRLWGQDVEVAHDGEEALELAARFRPEVILLDIGLPGMSGFDVAEKLKDRTEAGDLVLVAMTGWGQDEHLRRSREAGFAHHLVKPVDLDALRRVLDEAKLANVRDEMQGVRPL